MVIGGGQPGAGQVIAAMAIGEDVHRRALQVAALGQDPAGALGLQPPGRLFQVLGGVNLQAGEAGGLRGIGGQEEGQGEELFLAWR